ncbi:MAG: hypothetical protein KAW88_09410 [Candidatus Cloacimonetes bacterium]|nr:hypothetical protein [Candidatus Cloacimonadota bacterium]
MRPIERKVFQKITDKGINFEDVLEILDRTSTQEMKKSFPDDCHFQSDKYFAKLILNSLLRYKLIRKDGAKFFKSKQDLTCNERSECESRIAVNEM